MKASVLIILLILITLNACKALEIKENSQLNTPPQQKTLSDIQIIACNTAHEAGTCETRLAEIGIVLKEDCCEVLGKCC